MTVRPRVLLPFIEGELDSRSFAAAAQLAALHLSQDPFLYADWNVTFDLTYVELNDTTEDGAHLSPTHACVGRVLNIIIGFQQFESAQGSCGNGMAWTP